MIEQANRVQAAFETIGHRCERGDSVVIHDPSGPGLGLYHPGTIVAASADQPTVSVETIYGVHTFSNYDGRWMGGPTLDLTRARIVLGPEAFSAAPAVDPMPETYAQAPYPVAQDLLRKAEAELRENLSTARAGLTQGRSFDVEGESPFDRRLRERLR